MFLSPTWFAKEEVSESAVSANLTPTLLGSWIFAGSLSLPLKSEIARRLLDYPDSLEKQPLLTAAVDCLCNPTPLRRFLLAAMTPAGLAQNAILRWVEYGAILREMITYRRSGKETRARRKVRVTSRQPTTRTGRNSRRPPRRATSPATTAPSTAPPRFPQLNAPHSARDARAAPSKEAAATTEFAARHRCSPGNGATSACSAAG